MTARGLAPRERVFYAGNCAYTEPLARIEAAARAGFTATTLFLSDLPPLAAAGLDDVAAGEAIRSRGVKLMSLETVANWIPGQDRQPSALPANLRRALLGTTPEVICQRAERLGASRVLVIDLFGMPCDATTVAHHLRNVCDVAADHGLAVSVELIPRSCVGSLQRAREIMERVDRAGCGLLLDSWHFFRSGSSLDDLARLPAEFIAEWQVSDALLVPATTDLFADMNARCFPGEGEFDLHGFMRALARTGTTGPGGIEAFVPRQRGLALDEIASRSASALADVLEWSAEL